MPRWRASSSSPEPRLQGSGIGGALVELVEHKAASTGAVEVSLDTSEKAETLIAWYLGCGFRFVQWVRWEVVNYRSVVLTKDVRGIRVASTGAAPSSGNRPDYDVTTGRRHPP